LQTESDIGGRKGDFEPAAAQAYPALTRAATVLCWSRSDVDDVVQETMLSAFKSYDLFRGDSSFFTWAYRILVRAAHAANQKRARVLPSDYAMGQAQQLPPADRAIILDEEARGVIDAIRSLPERQREIITLHLLEQLSYAEISSAMEVSLGTVKATIFQAKTSLRATLASKGIVRKSIHELS
jgi:RNA polymerase sigma-70 factor (ECF subfamily)